VPENELLIGFFVATAIFSYIPGPAMLYATAQTIARGRRAGLMAAIGIHVGGYAHVFAAAFGLAILFEAVPTLYLTVKLIGALYLVWLGLRIVLSRKNDANPPLQFESKSARRAFWESVAVEVLNPKTAIFFLAFLPQFADAGASWPLSIQLLVLGIIVNFMFSSADLLCVMLAGTIERRLKESERASRLAQRLGGGVMIGLGVNLAFSRS